MGALKALAGSLSANGHAATARQADCGDLVSAVEEEPAFDPAAVTVPQGQCGVSPGEITPPQEVTLTATVRNRNAASASATVEWSWQGGVLATVDVIVSSNGTARAETTVTIEAEGRGPVTAQVVSATELAGRAPATVAEGGISLSAPFAGCTGCKRRSRALTERYWRARDRLDPLEV